VDARGVLRDVFQDENGSVYGKGVLAVQIPLPAEGASHQLTFYTRHGDWFGWGCVAAGGMLLAVRTAQRKSRRGFGFH
jgi:apolipoprotein N-acyltransferase